MHVCIVGGTGNISTSIVRLLLDEGHQVTVYNRGKSEAPPAGVRVIVGDRKDRAAFEAAMQKEQFDAAIDMICFDADDAASSVRAFRGVGHFVQCSTVCTYGIHYDWLPVSEDHPLRPISGYGRNKVAADHVFLAAYHGSGFPVTIIKPSTTYGPKMGVLRQVAWEFTWIDRIRQGKPVVICGDGSTLHQFLHVDDAAPAFTGVLGRPECFGQTYNMMKRGHISWADHHRTVMKVIGREVELVGVPLATLEAANVPNIGICREIFAWNGVFDPAKLFRDVPGFAPKISLEAGIAQSLEAMDRLGKLPSAATNTWEDALIAAQRKVGELKLG